MKQEEEKEEAVKMMMNQQQGQFAVSELRRKLDEDMQSSSKLEIEKALIERALSEFVELEINLAAAIDENEATKQRLTEKEEYCVSVISETKEALTSNLNASKMLSDGMHEQRETIRVLDEELSLALAKNSHLEKRVDEDGKLIKELKGMVESSLVGDDELKKEVSNVKKQSCQLEKRIKEKDKAIRKADAAIAKQGAKISGLSNQMLILEKKNSGLELQLKKREEELDSSQEMVQLIDARNQVIQETMDDLRTQLEAKEVEVKTFRESWRNVESLKEEILDRMLKVVDIEQLQQSIGDRKRDNLRLGEALEHLESKLDEGWRAAEEDMKSSKEEIYQIRKGMDEMTSREGEVKELMRVGANELVESEALILEECTSDLVKRISKANREVKEWKKLGDEMLEKRVRELEEGMLLLHEEKREAIRQLCVWIEYQRDFCKNIVLSKMRRRPT